MDARAIVKLAASRIQSSDEARSWLERDELGSWERDARAFIESSAAKRAELGISDEQAASDIADALCLRALQSLIKWEKTHGRASRGRT